MFCPPEIPLLTTQQFERTVANLSPKLNGHSRNRLNHYGFTRCREMEVGAPETFEKVAQAMVIKPFGKEFPVYADAHHEKTVFGKNQWAYRAWHDITHVEVAGAFTLTGEVPVIEEQLIQLSVLGCSQIERTIVWLDIMGQLLHEARHGTFPEHARAFVEAAACKGLKFALSLKW